MQRKSDPVYITLRCEALTNILKLLASSTPRANTNNMLDHTFYTCVKDSFCKLKRVSDDNTDFLHKIALQAKKLNWGDWEWEHSKQHTMLTVTAGPFVANHTGVGAAISFYGPIRGVVRAAIYALGNPASDTIHHRIEPGRIIYQHYQAH